MADNTPGNSLKDRILNALNNLASLEIITAVGHATPEGDNGPDLDYSRNPKMILTKINLLQGDIKTVYHEDFVTGPYQNLKNYHAAREKEGYDIIMRNMDAIERLLKLAETRLEG